VTKILIAVFAASLAACSPCEPTDYFVGPVCVDDRVLTEVERAEVRAAIAPALFTGIGWWGARPEEMSGVRIVFSDSHITFVEGSTITLFRRSDMADTAPCGAYLVRGLPHEIGHIVLSSRAPWTGDGNHHDHRWDKEDAILSDLYARDPSCGELP
jgi:hypothetical protein